MRNFLLNKGLFLTVIISVIILAIAICCYFFFFGDKPILINYFYPNGGTMIIPTFYDSNGNLVTKSGMGFDITGTKVIYDIKYATFSINIINTGGSSITGIEILPYTGESPYQSYGQDMLDSFKNGFEFPQTNSIRPSETLAMTTKTPQCDFTEILQHDDVNNEDYCAIDISKYENCGDGCLFGITVRVYYANGNFEEKSAGVILFITPLSTLPQTYDVRTAEWKINATESCTWSYETGTTETKPVWMTPCKNCQISFTCPSGDVVGCSILDNSITKTTCVAGTVCNYSYTYQFDFGTSTSPTETNFIKITRDMIYSADYGWMTNPSDDRDRGTGSDLERDFIFDSANRTFSIKADGDYIVTVLLGDKSYAHDNMNVYAEGVWKLKNINTAAGEIKRLNFSTTVTDNKLDIMFNDGGGTDPYWIVDGLIIKSANELSIHYFHNKKYLSCSWCINAFQSCRQSQKYYFDFGTTTSDVEKNYIGVSQQTVYSTVQKYGWDSSLSSIDRSLGTNLTKDLVYSSSDKEFKLDLANGIYNVMLYMGDMSYPHDNMDVFMENNLVASINTSAGQIKTIKKLINVSDEQLNIKLHDSGGSDANWVANGLIVYRSDIFCCEGSCKNDVCESEYKWLPQPTDLLIIGGAPTTSTTTPSTTPTTPSTTLTTSSTTTTPTTSTTTTSIPNLVFDTGTPPSPASSIWGLHLGTITPSHDIIVAKVRAYQMQGTGGHVTSMLIYNSTFAAEATFPGYYLAGGVAAPSPFNVTFDMKAGKTYNYELYTDSYPQLWGLSQLTVSDGTVTCSYFKDANGYEYTPGSIVAFYLTSA